MTGVTEPRVSEHTLFLLNEFQQEPGVRIASEHAGRIVNAGQISGAEVHQDLLRHDPVALVARMHPVAGEEKVWIRFSPLAENSIHRPMQIDDVPPGAALPEHPVGIPIKGGSVSRAFAFGFIKRRRCNVNDSGTGCGRRVAAAGQGHW